MQGLKALSKSTKSKRTESWFYNIKALCENWLATNWPVYNKYVVFYSFLTPTGIQNYALVLFPRKPLT